MRLHSPRSLVISGRSYSVMNRFIETCVSMGDFFTYYVKGRVFEWTMALAMLFAGAEVLIWSIMNFGAPLILLSMLDQKWVGSLLFFIGWIRLSALMFNGQLLFGRKLGWGIRAICAVLSASLWAQFTAGLIILSFTQGYPSVGLPFWAMFTIAELIVAYSIGAEWKK